jgi:hypothetical protein
MVGHLGADPPAAGDGSGLVLGARVRMFEMDGEVIGFPGPGLAQVRFSTVFGLTGATMTTVLPVQALMIMLKRADEDR